MITLYKNHSGRIGSWEGWTEGNIVHSRSCTVLGGSWVPSQYTAVGKNIGRSNETTPEEQAILELESKSRLKIDKGYVKTKKEAQVVSTNSLGLPKPMLAAQLDKVKPESIDWETAFVQPKLDGHRALYKDGVLYSRAGKVIDLPHIVEAIESCSLKNLHLDGELYLHGKTLQEVSSLIKGAKKNPEASLDVEYWVYDIVSDKPFSERSEMLWEAYDTSDRAYTYPVKWTETTEVKSLEEAMQHHEKYREFKMEGTMIRFGTDGYQVDKRSKKLLKVKEFHDAEFKVIGYEEGKPYIRGDEVFQVPVWICETEDGGNFNVTASGNMYEKAMQWDEKEDLVGEMLTVKYHNMSKDNIPQLPVALDWRFDL